MYIKVHIDEAFEVKDRICHFIHLLYRTIRKAWWYRFLEVI